MKFSEYLESIKACEIAVLWVGDRDPQTAWAECPRGDWMEWLLDAHGIPLDAAFLAKCATLYDDYLAKCATLYADYRAKRAPLDADYEAKRATLLREFQSKMPEKILSAVSGR